MSITTSTAATGGHKPDDIPTAATPSSANIDLVSCTPDELSAWLLKHRFEDNAMDVASFLLTCTSTLPDAEKISEQLLGGGNDDDNDEDMEDVEKKNTTAVEDTKPAAASSDPQTTLLQSIQASQQHPTFATNNEIIEVSCINPRGKFQLSIYKSGIILTNPKKPEEVIPISNKVSNVVWFRKPEDYKKMKQLVKNGGGGSGGKGKKDKGIPGHMVLICLEEGNMFRNKPLKQVCFQLPTYPSQSTAEGNNSTQLNEKSWWDGLNSSLFTEDEAKKSDIIRVNASMETGKSSNGFVFKSAGEQGSSSTTEGLPFVGCYQGFNDGALFPLKEGLLFFKPPMLVPRSELASISCGRGAGGSRYVDMEVKLHVSDDNEHEGKKKQQSDTLEWSNINRDELEGLNNYIHKTLIPAMQMDADGTNEEASDGNSSDDDDDDFAVAEVVNTSDDEEKKGGDDDSEESSRKRRPSRAASKSAREINKAALAGADEDEDSDDDSGEFEEEEDSDESDEEESAVSEKSDEAGSSSEDEDEEEANDSDGSDYRDSKKARVE